MLGNALEPLRQFAPAFFRRPPSQGPADSLGPRSFVQRHQLCHSSVCEELARFGWWFCVHTHRESAQGLEAIESLCALSKTDNVCVMCSEADWTECHRQVIATELQKKGFVITHLKRDGGKDQHPEVIRYPKWLIEHQDGDGIDQLQQSCTAHVEEVAEKKKRRWNKR
eukprot:GEMP01087057.1.p1 GENE.GEMP01087057.1~~GEMP01087057.1.p1  ORF type:complete len:168 (+),score=29.64 GEMP01087057.1:415-918(+)